MLEGMLKGASLGTVESILEHGRDDAARCLLRGGVQGGA